MVSKGKITNLAEVFFDDVDDDGKDEMYYRPREDPKAYNIYQKRKFEACYLVGNSNQGVKFLRKLIYLKTKIERILLYHPITNFRLVKRVLIALRPDEGYKQPKWLKFLHTLFRIRKKSFKQTSGLANEIR